MYFRNTEGYEVQREERFPPRENSKLYCLMLTLLVLCGSGILICVLTAGIIYAVQQAK